MRLGVLVPLLLGGAACREAEEEIRLQVRDFISGAGPPPEQLSFLPQYYAHPLPRWSFEPTFAQILKCENTENSSSRQLSTRRRP